MPTRRSCKVRHCRTVEHHSTVTLSSRRLLPHRTRMPVPSPPEVNRQCTCQSTRRAVRPTVALVTRHRAQRTHQPVRATVQPRRPTHRPHRHTHQRHRATRQRVQATHRRVPAIRPRARATHRPLPRTTLVPRPPVRATLPRVRPTRHRVPHTHQALRPTVPHRQPIHRRVLVRLALATLRPVLHILQQVQAIVQLHRAIHHRAQLILPLLPATRPHLPVTLRHHRGASNYGHDGQVEERLIC